MMTVFNEIIKYTKPLCDERQFAAKISNFNYIRNAFAQREEFFQGLPFQIHLEPSGECNLKCPICPRGVGIIKRTGFLAYSAFEKAFDAISETLTSIVISGFGEPLLNKDTCRMIKLASKASVATFMNSNGTVLADQTQHILDAQLTRVNISLDGAVSKSTHQYSDDHPFAAVVHGIESLRKKKENGRYRYPSIVGQFIICDETADEMADLKKWAIEIGVEEIRFKRKHPTMPSELERKKVLAKYDLKEITGHKEIDSEEKLNWDQKKCSHPWESFFLSCTGEISVCSFDPHLKNKFGDVNDDFRSIWFGDKIRKIRKMHSGPDALIKVPCSKCNRLPGYLVLKD